MNFKEIETKYRATDIKLTDFCSCVESIGKHNKIKVGSYDKYFSKGDAEFIRYRDGDTPQLTVKVKSTDNNNFIRTEVNLPLCAKLNEEERLKTVTAFCETVGFKHNFTIYKNCIIYFFDRYNVVFYLVYDQDLKEKDRFIEIEMDEKVQWASEEEAWNELIEVEKKLSKLGINPQNRLRKSLYEMLRRA